MRDMPATAHRAARVRRGHAGRRACHGCEGSGHRRGAAHRWRWSAVGRAFPGPVPSRRELDAGSRFGGGPQAGIVGATTRRPAQASHREVKRPLSAIVPCPAVWWNTSGRTSLVRRRARPAASQPRDAQIDHQTAAVLAGIPPGDDREHRPVLLSQRRRSGLRCALSSWCSRPPPLRPGQCAAASAPRRPAARSRSVQLTHRQGARKKAGGGGASGARRHQPRHLFGRSSRSPSCRRPHLPRRSESGSTGRGIDQIATMGKPGRHLARPDEQPAAVGVAMTQNVTASESPDLEAVGEDFHGDPRGRSRFRAYAIAGAHRSSARRVPRHGVLAR